MGVATKAVLIVEDDQNIARTFARILQKNGYQTDVAQTGREAIQKVSARCFSAALIDVCLPDMDGMQLLNELVDKDCRIVKVIITGFPAIALQTDKKADAYLLKPVKPQELLALLEQKTQGK
ncbi:MAG: response regulator [Candidatus Bathyarchaeota archaeon]|nr:response regulator [Candidatus Bathyarchaeota archaeon]